MSKAHQFWKLALCDVTKGTDTDALCQVLVFPPSHLVPLPFKHLEGCLQTSIRIIYLLCNKAFF